MSIDVSTPADLKYIVALSKRHATELGFLPTQAMEHYLLTRRVRMARENGDPCGYFLHSKIAEHVRIFQACVQIDARGLDHGIALLSDLISRTTTAGGRRITLHCRDGLASNGFWSACGFKLAGLALGGAARRKIINVWELTVADALANPSLPYGADFFRRIQNSLPAGKKPPAFEAVARPSPCAT